MNEITWDLQSFPPAGAIDKSVDVLEPLAPHRMFTRGMMMSSELLSLEMSYGDAYNSNEHSKILEIRHRMQLAPSLEGVSILVAWRG